MHNIVIENGETSMMYVGGLPWHGLGTNRIKAHALTFAIKMLPNWRN